MLYSFEFEYFWSTVLVYTDGLTCLFCHDKQRPLFYYEYVVLKFTCILFVTSILEEGKYSIIVRFRDGNSQAHGIEPLTLDYDETSYIAVFYLLIFSHLAMYDRSIR